MKRGIPFPVYWTILILLSASLLESCIKDNRDHCYTCCQLVVKTIEADSVQAGDIEEVVLYIFDQEQKFIGSLKTEVDQATELSYPNNKELYVIAWGNINSGSQTLTEPVSGQAPGDIYLALNMQDDSHASSPDDLFQGVKTVPLGNARTNVLWINRKIARVTVVARGLQHYLDTRDVDFTYLIRGSGRTVDLNASPTGDEAYLQPEAGFDVNQDFRTSAFHVFASEKLTVDIYKAGQLVYSIDHDSDGNPFAAPEGKKVTILIDFAAGARVTVTIDDWTHTEVTSEQ